jgi:glycosyltransferase involved in cell wall biosynthesis
MSGISAFRSLFSCKTNKKMGCKALKIPANVRHIGYIQNLAPIYSAVDYTILPSHYEPFGLVIPESLQCGTPVITTRDVGAAELLSKQDSIVLDNNQPETIATAIRQLGKALPVASNFAGRHRLTISQHVADIKALYPALHSR